MIIGSGPPVLLGTPSPLVRIGTEPGPEGGWSGRRLLLLDDVPAFELSFPCGTCQFLFTRLDGTTITVSVDELRQRLTQPMDGVPHDVVGAFGRLLEQGSYLPLLLTVVPEPVRPGDGRDYFSNDQVRTWGLDASSSLPVDPRTTYYRTYETAVDTDAHLYEFVVPMVPPQENDPDQVSSYVAGLTAGETLTVVAVSILDVCAPAVDSQATDYYTHWGLTHFLLDGHHKLDAAAQAGRSVQVLSLLSLESGLSTPAQLARLTRIRSREQRSRAEAGRGRSRRERSGEW